MLKSSPVGVFASPELAADYIREEEQDDETGEGYYRMEAWDPFDVSWENPRYEYYFYGDEICWFKRLIPQKQSHGNTYYMPDRSRIWTCDNDLNLMTPYKTGDIVLIDCRPFGPPFHAMILEARDQFDCCLPNIVFNVAATDEWWVCALKHRMFYKSIELHSYEPMLSPLFRLRKVRDDELTEEDERLIKLSRILSGREELAQNIWKSWPDDSIGETNWDKVKALFIEEEKAIKSAE